MDPVQALSLSPPPVRLRVPVVWALYFRQARVVISRTGVSLFGRV